MNLSDWAALVRRHHRALIGVLVWIWWLDSAPSGATVVYATAIGASWASPGDSSSEWLSDLLTSLW